MVDKKIKEQNLGLQPEAADYTQSMIMRLRYEYKRVPANNLEILNTLGADGWKIVSVDNNQALMVREY